MDCKSLGVVLKKNFGSLSKGKVVRVLALAMCWVVLGLNFLDQELTRQQGAMNRLSNLSKLGLFRGDPNVLTYALK